MRLFSRLWIFPLLFVAVSQFARSQQLDISGIQMGMSLEQAKAKIGPGYTYLERKFNDPLISALFAYKSNDAWAFETIDKRLVYINHFVHFAAQDRPNSADTLDRLVRKYGPAVPGTYTAWAFPPSGSSLNGPRLHACATARGSQPFSLVLGAPFNGTMYVPTGGLEGCGITIYTGVNNLSGRPYMVEEFTISMIDLQALYVEGARFTAVQQQQQSDTLNKAKQNKAPF